MTVIETVREKLTRELSAEHIDIIDNTWMHKGHAAAQGRSHLHITIVSPAFQGVSLLDRHRKVHQVLSEEMGPLIHALELKTLAPQEWQQV
jgi:BolA protein